jgi:hypothetical protein
VQALGTFSPAAHVRVQYTPPGRVIPDGQIFFPEQPISDERFPGFLENGGPDYSAAEMRAKSVA